MSDGPAALIVASASALMSAGILLVSRRTFERAAHDDRRDLFLKVHERLTSPDLQRGRRHLFEVYDWRRDFTMLTPTERDEANRAVAEFDVAALYCKEGYIDEAQFLELWAPSLVKLRYAADPLLAERQDYLPGVTTWQKFLDLAAAGELHLRAKGVVIEDLIRRKCDRQIIPVHKRSLRQRLASRLPQRRPRSVPVRRQRP